MPDTKKKNPTVTANPSNTKSHNSDSSYVYLSHIPFTFYKTLKPTREINFFLDKIRRTERPQHEHTIVVFQPCNTMLQILRLPPSPTGLGIHKS